MVKRLISKVECLIDAQTLKVLSYKEFIDFYVPDMDTLKLHIVERILELDIPNQVKAYVIHRLYIKADEDILAFESIDDSTTSDFYKILEVLNDYLERWEKE